MSLHWAIMSKGMFSHVANHMQNMVTVLKLCTPKLPIKWHNYANSADPDQTAPEGAVWSGSTQFAFPPYILRNYCIKNKIWAKKVWSKMFKFLEHLPHNLNLNYNIRKHTFDMCTKHFKDSNQPVHPCSLISLCYMQKETLHPWLSKMCPVKIQIRLRICAVWSESSLGSHVRRYIFLRCCLYYYFSRNFFFSLQEIISCLRFQVLSRKMYPD